MDEAQGRVNTSSNWDLQKSDSESLFDSEFIRKIERLSLSSNIIIPDGASGNRKSKSKGSSVEFSDYREYSIGDDFRRIDWNAYGRFEKLFIKLFMEEREAPVHIFLDTSRSMDFGNPKKSFSSRRLAAALGYLCLSNYDNVSVLCVNKIVDKMKLSMRGKNNFSELLGFLEEIQYRDETDIYSAIKQAEFRGNRGISVIISDLFSCSSQDRPNSGEQGRRNLMQRSDNQIHIEAISYFEKTLKFLQYKKQDVYVCHTLSPQETDPVLNGELRLLDAETGQYIDVTASTSVVAVYKDVLNRFVQELQKVCFKHGMKYLFMNTKVPVEQIVRDITSM